MKTKCAGGREQDAGRKQGFSDNCTLKTDNFAVSGLVLTVLTLGILWVSPVLAGNLDSPGPPGSGSGMPTLQGVYGRLDTGAFLNVSGSFAGPAAGPGATGVTLNNI